MSAASAVRPMKVATMSGESISRKPPSESGSVKRNCSSVSDSISPARGFSCPGTTALASLRRATYGRAHTHVSAYSTTTPSVSANSPHAAPAQPSRGKRAAQASVTPMRKIVARFAFSLS